MHFDGLTYSISFYANVHKTEDPGLVEYKLLEI